MPLGNQQEGKAQEVILEVKVKLLELNLKKETKNDILLP